MKTSLESINAKMEGLSSAIKSQLSFNKMLKHNWLSWLLLFLLLNQERFWVNPNLPLNMLIQ